jgi:hypothetical protein
VKRFLSAITLMAITLGGAQVTSAKELESNIAVSQTSVPLGAVNSLITNRDEAAKPQQKILTDYPGRMRSVTEKQKAEIKAVLEASQSNTKFICTGIRLEGQPQGMNVVVRLRAKLVCDYAKSLRPDMSFWYQSKITNTSSYNGRVMVSTK